MEKSQNNENKKDNGLTIILLTTVFIMTTILFVGAVAIGGFGFGLSSFVMTLTSLILCGWVYISLLWDLEHDFPTFDELETPFDIVRYFTARFIYTVIIVCMVAIFLLIVVRIFR